MADSVAPNPSAMCADHPDKPSMAQCIECHKNLCSLCIQRTTGGSIVCLSCFERAERAAPLQADKKKESVGLLILKILLAIVIVIVVLLATCFGLLFMICGKK